MKKNISWSPKFRVIGTFFYGLVVSDVQSSSLKKTVKWTLLPVSYSKQNLYLSQECSFILIFLFMPSHIFTKPLRFYKV